METHWLQKYKIAHRGYHTSDKSILENTKEAFIEAIKHDYAIELDTNILNDGNVVIFHDPNLKRMANLNKQLRKMTLGEIRNIKLIDNKSTIMTFQEMLELVDGKVPLVIELKPFGGYKRHCEEVYRLLQQYQGKFVIQSFDPRVLLWFKKHAPEVLRGQITETFIEEPIIPGFLKYFMSSMKLNFLTKPHFINYKIQDLPNKFIERSKRKGRLILGYVARNQIDFDFMINHYDNCVFEYFNPA